MARPKKVPRSAQRALAFQVLYSLALAPEQDIQGVARAFAVAPEQDETGARENAREGFAWELVEGVWKNQAVLDKRLAAFSENWRVDRMGKVEITLLRLALYEIIFRNDIPAKVAINEAIELSKQFGDDSSRGFINGILDAAAKAAEKG